MDKLTVEQAIDQGYTHCSVYNSDYVMKIDFLLKDGLPDYHKGEKIVLIGKDRLTFSISATDIQQALENHIENQEEYFCYDNTLHGELAVADFDKIAELVNVGFTTGFMFPTEIELDLTGLLINKGK